MFGSRLAIVPFLHDGVVREHQWLTERQFLDAVAVALITLSFTFVGDGLRDALDPRDQI